MNARAETMSEMGAAARRLAGHGFHVFPVPPGKKMGCEKSENHNGRRWGASNDPQIVRQLFTKHPTANVGIACQESRIFVIEGDVKNGVNGVEWMAKQIAEHGEWPETVEALSPSGSWHVYFRYPADFDPNTGQSEIAPGVDVRGHGGMVIAPPSIKLGPFNPYRWKNAPDQFEVAECPAWLLAKVPHRPREQRREKSEGGGFDVNNASFKSVEDYRRLFLAASTDGQKHAATVKIASSFAGQGVSQRCATGLIQAVCPVWEPRASNPPAHVLKFLMKVAHPDQHANAPEANEALRWLLDFHQFSRIRGN